MGLGRHKGIRSTSPHRALAAAAAALAVFWKRCARPPPRVSQQTPCRTQGGFRNDVTPGSSRLRGLPNCAQLEHRHRSFTHTAIRAPRRRHGSAAARVWQTAHVEHIPGGADRGAEPPAHPGAAALGTAPAHQEVRSLMCGGAGVCCGPKHSGRLCR